MKFSKPQQFGLGGIGGGQGGGQGTGLGGGHGLGGQGGGQGGGRIGGTGRCGISEQHWQEQPLLHDNMYNKIKYSFIIYLLSFPR